MKSSFTLLRIAAVACVMSIGLSGCFDIGGSSKTVDSTTSTLSVSGTASQQAVAGTLYSFTPTQSGSGTLTYTASGLPAWLKLDSGTGSLTGTPATGDVGSTSTVTLTATAQAAHGTFSSMLGPFTITVVATATDNVAAAGTGTGTATVRWSASTDPDIVGYKVYYGTTPNDLSQVVSIAGASVASYVVKGLASGTWYFGLRSYTAASIESDLSNLGSKTIL